MWLLNRTLQISGIWIAFPVTEFLVCAAAAVLMKRDRKIPGSENAADA